jgi:uncharacterized membrane protein YdbT with pleckstrin-like domain
MNEAEASCVAAAENQPDSAVIWSSSEGQFDNIGYFASCLTFCWLLVPLMLACVRYLGTALHAYELTPQRLRERTGILNRQTEELELYRVKDIAVEQPLSHRLFGRGRIVLQTSDRSTPMVVINCIAMPHQVAQLLRDHVEKCRVTKGVREID